MTTLPADALLARGGMRRLAGPAEAGPVESAATRPSEMSKCNGALDPAGAEALGRQLAAELRSSPVDAVLVWEDVEDLVLAHVVARELGVAVVRAFDADGLVELTGAVEPGARIVLLSDMFRDPAVLSAMRSLVEMRRGRVAAFASLVDSPVTASFPERTVSLGLPSDADAREDT